MFAAYLGPTGATSHLTCSQLKGTGAITASWRSLYGQHSCHTLAPQASFGNLGNFETGRREHQHQRREVRTTTLLFAQRCVPPHPLASQASALKAVTRTHLPPAAVFLIVDDRIWPPGQPCRRSSAYSRQVLLWTGKHMRVQMLSARLT